MNIRSSLAFVYLFFLLVLIASGLGAARAPLLLAFILSYLLFPLILKIEGKGVNRHVTVVSVFTVIFLMLGVLIALLFPVLIEDFKEMAKAMPGMVDSVLHKVEVVSAWLGFPIQLQGSQWGDLLALYSGKLSGSMVKGVSGVITEFLGSAIGGLLGILNLFFIPLFFFYVIDEYEKIVDELKSFVPGNIRETVFKYSKISNKILSGYIRGQMIVALIMALLYGIGLSVVGLKFGLVIGLLAGVISIIPYAGITIGFATSVIVAISNNQGIEGLVGVALVFGIVQFLEGFIITPKLVGNKVGLSPFITMLALIIGGNLFGLFGMVIAIPVAGIIKVSLEDIKLAI